MQMDALRSWWEIPSIAHFCSLFRAAFQLPDFDIEDLEQGLLAVTSDEGSPFLEDLFCRLLQGCYGRDDIEHYNYEIYLKDIMKGWALQTNTENYLENREFKDIGLKQKVEILKNLCDARLDSLDVMDQLKGFEGDNMRVEALGKDSGGATYWYFYGSRLYKEDPELVVEEPTKHTKVRKKKKEKDKKAKLKTDKGKKSKGKPKKHEQILNKKEKKAKQQKETPQATRSSSRTSTRISSRMRVLEDQRMEEDEEESEEEEEAGDASEESDKDQNKTMKTQRSSRKYRSLTKAGGRRNVVKEKDEEESEDADSDEEQIKTTKTHRSSRKSRSSGRVGGRRKVVEEKDEEESEDEDADSDEEQMKTTKTQRSSRKSRPSARVGGRRKVVEEKDEDESEDEDVKEDDAGSDKEQMEMTKRRRSSRRPCPSAKVGGRRKVAEEKNDEDNEEMLDGEDIGSDKEESKTNKKQRLSRTSRSSTRGGSRRKVQKKDYNESDDDGEEIDWDEEHLKITKLKQLEESDETDEDADDGDVDWEEEHAKAMRKQLTRSFTHCAPRVRCRQRAGEVESTEENENKAEVQDRLVDCKKEDIDETAAEGENVHQGQTQTEHGLKKEEDIKDEKVQEKEEFEPKTEQCDVTSELESNEKDSEKEIKNEDTKMETEEEDKAESTKMEIEKDLKEESTNMDTEKDVKEEIIKMETEKEFKDEDTKMEDTKTENQCELENTKTSTDNSDKENQLVAENTNNCTTPLYLGLPLPEVNSRWHLICSTFEDWEALATSFQTSKVKCEKDLCRCISQDFLPAIPGIIEAREQERKKRLLEQAPKRISSRIKYKRREQEEQEKILAEAEAEEDRQRKVEEEERRKILELEREEEEKRLREERQRNREERAKRLEQREQRAQLIAEGKEIPPELKYTAATSNSKYREDEEKSGQQPELTDEDIEEMENVLKAVKSHKDAWPFMDPVDDEVAPGYLEVIKRPMDLSLIEKKLNNRIYKSKKRFINDFNLMFENCRHFNGIESDLGMMTQKLQRCLNKAVKVNIDKVKDNYEADEEFRIAQAVKTEKRWRPRRAASSRAMDTLHRAFNWDEDDLEDDSDEDKDGSRSPKPPTDKILRLEPPKSLRLIPELSANHDEEGWDSEQSKHINKKADPKWNVDGNIISFNGKKLLYNYSKQNRQTSASSLSLLDARKFTPYKPQCEIKPSPPTPVEGKVTRDITTAVYNGQSYVYTVSKPLRKATNRSPSKWTTASSPIRPLSPKGAGAPLGLTQPLSGGFVKQLSPAGQAKIIAGHGQSGGTVRVATPPAAAPPGSSPFTINTSTTPSGQRIIKIVAAPGQQRLKPGQVINLADLGLAGSGKLAGSVLRLASPNLAGGKARIVYQTSVKTTAALSSSPTVTSSPSVNSNSLLSMPGQQKPAIITLGPGSLPLSKSNVALPVGLSTVQQQDVIKNSISVVSPVAHSTPQGQECAATRSGLVGALVAGNTDSSSASDSVTPNPTVSNATTDAKFVISDNLMTSENTSESEHSNSSDDDTPELFPMNPPRQLPKKRKTMDGSGSPGSSPSKVFIQGIDTTKGGSPPRQSTPGSPPRLPAAGSPPCTATGTPPKVSTPPKLFSPPLSFGPPQLSCPPRIQSPPKCSGPPNLTPIRPLDSNSKYSDWKQNVNSKFPPFKTSQTQGPNENRQSVFDALDSKENVTRHNICDSESRTGDNINKGMAINSTEQTRTSTACVSNNSCVNTETVSGSAEHRLHGSSNGGTDSTLDTSKKSPDKGNLFDNFATFMQPPVGRSLFDGQNTSSSSMHSSTQSSSVNVSSHSNRYIFDSISPVTNSLRQNASPPKTVAQSDAPVLSTSNLSRNMMDKVSAFAANLHTGFLACRLGSLSPTKLSPSGAANQHHPPHLAQEMSRGGYSQQHPTVPQYLWRGYDPRGVYPTPQRMMYPPPQGLRTYLPTSPLYYQRQSVVMPTDHSNQYRLYGYRGSQYHNVDQPGDGNT